MIGLSPEEMCHRDSNASKIELRKFWKLNTLSMHFLVVVVCYSSTIFKQIYEIKGSQHTRAFFVCFRACYTTSSYFFCFFMLSSGPSFHLVFRWRRDLNPRPRTIAWIVSPRRSPPDQGLSPTTSSLCMHLLQCVSFRKSLPYNQGKLFLNSSQYHTCVNMTWKFGCNKKYGVWARVLITQAIYRPLNCEIFLDLCALGSGSARSLGPPLNHALKPQLSLID